MKFLIKLDIQYVASIWSGQLFFLGYSLALQILAFKLAEACNKLEKCFENLLNKKNTQLSTGSRQSLSLCAGLFTLVLIGVNCIC
jgi:ABC-type uncharacterized transport system ATPase component